MTGPSYADRAWHASWSSRQPPARTPRSAARRRSPWPSTAVASGVDVSFWLTGESTWFALPGRAAEFELPHAAPLPDLLAILLDAGRVTACTQCAARRGIGPDDVLPGIRIAGAAVFVEEIMSDGAQALVY